MTATLRGISVEGRHGSIDREGDREYTVIYKVGTDNKTDGIVQVRNAAGIPSVGDIYAAGNDSDFAAVVVGKEVSQGDSPFEWEVEVTYSTDLDLKPPAQHDNPLVEPAELSFGFQTRRILIPGYYNNPIGPPADGKFQQGIFAPNGELFDPQPEAEIADPIWHIKRNVSLGTFSYADLMALANCVNADYFLGVSPRQLMMQPPAANRRFHKTIGFYWELSYSLLYRWETWDIQILNQGTYYFAGGKPTTVWSTTIARKVKTDEHGNVLTINLTTDGDVNSTATPTFTTIRFYREINFTPLGLI